MNLLKNILFIALFASVSTLKTNAQVYGGQWSDYGYSFCQTFDGGLLLCGDSANIIYLIKTNNLGQKQWSKTIYDNVFNNHANAVAQTADSGFIIMGTFDNSGILSTSAWLLRLNQLGDTIWTKKYNSAFSEWGLSAYVKPNGNFVLATVADGMTASNPVTVFETDSLGNEIWSQGVNGSAYFGGVAQELNICSDGGFIAATTNSNDFSIELDRLDSAGNFIFQKSFSDTNFIKAYGANASCETGDGGYLVAGSKGDFAGGFGSTDFLWMKVDSAGDSLWTKTIVNPDYDELTAIRKCPNGGFVCAGNSGSFGRYADDVILLRLDDNGDTLWTKSYGNTGPENVRYMEVTAEGNIIMIGDTGDAFQSCDVWLLVTDSSGNVLNTLTTGIRIPEVKHKMNIYPNPACDNVNIDCSSFSGKDLHISIYNNSGTRLKWIFIPAAKNCSDRINVPMEDMVAGQVYIELISDNIRFVESVTIQK